MEALPERTSLVLLGEQLSISSLLGQRLRKHNMSIKALKVAVGEGCARIGEAAAVETTSGGENKELSAWEKNILQQP